MKNWISPVFVALAALTSFGSPADLAWAADSTGGAGIIFLNMSLVRDTVRLEDWSLRTGKLKRSRLPGTREGILFEVLSKGDRVLWQGTVSDPRTQRMESADPAKPGHLLVQVIRSDSAHFIVRIPADLEATQVRFYAVQATDQPVEKEAARRPLGEIVWPKLPGKP